MKVNGRLIGGILAYAIPTMILGYTWHFNFFPEIYARLGIYNREPPIIPLGFASMVLQGIILSYIYPKLRPTGGVLKEGLRFGGVMGTFLFSVSTLASAAKIQVAPMSLWIGIQFAFHTVQFAIVGPCIAWVYRTPTEGQH